MDGDDPLTGEVRLGGCETIELSRRDEAADHPLPAELAGIWQASGGCRADGAFTMMLHVVPDGPLPFAEALVTYPMNRPEAET